MTKPSYLSAVIWANFLLSLAAAGAEAAPISFQADSAASPASLSAQIKVERVGSLQLRNGSVLMKGGTIEVKDSCDDSAQPSTVLKGRLLRVESDPDAIPAQITGLAYFEEGPSLPEIDDPRTGDLIFKRDGALSGRITGLSGYDLQVVNPGGQKTTIDVSTVKFVRSPRAFLFRISIDAISVIPNTVAFRANASSLTFKSTARERSLPFSSILPERSSQSADGRLSKCGEGASDTDPADSDYDDGIIPTFKWGMTGLPFKPPLPGGSGDGGI